MYFCRAGVGLEVSPIVGRVGISAISAAASADVRAGSGFSVVAAEGWNRTARVVAVRFSAGVEVGGDWFFGDFEEVQEEAQPYRAAKPNRIAIAVPIQLDFCFLPAISVPFLLKDSGQADGFPEDQYIAAVFGFIDDRRIGGVFGYQGYEGIGFIEAFQGSFVVDQDGGDFAVLNDRLFPDHDDVAVEDSGADHGVAANGQAEIGADGGFDHDFMFLVGEDGFSGGDIPEHGEALDPDGFETLNKIIYIRREINIVYRLAP